MVQKYIPLAGGGGEGVGRNIMLKIKMRGYQHVDTERINSRKQTTKRTKWWLRRKGARFELFTTVLVKTKVFLHLTPPWLVNSCRRFRGAYCFPLKSRVVQREWEHIYHGGCVWYRIRIGILKSVKENDGLYVTVVKTIENGNKKNNLTLAKRNIVCLLKRERRKGKLEDG